VERDIQQLQVDAQKQLAQIEAAGPGKPKRLTLIEARRQRCRQARYQRYLAVHELHREGQTQLEIAENVGIGAETVSRWLNTSVFPERRIRSDRRRDQASFLQSCERGLQPSLTRTHYSAGRVSALLNMPPPSLSPVQKRHLEAFFRFCPQVSSTAPFHSSVSSHDEMAKRQEVGHLDKGGDHVWIPFSGSVCEHAPP
jgi:hypothetical protein